MSPQSFEEDIDPELAQKIVELVESHKAAKFINAPTTMYWSDAIAERFEAGDRRVYIKGKMIDEPIRILSEAEFQFAKECVNKCADLKMLNGWGQFGDTLEIIVGLWRSPWATASH